MINFARVNSVAMSHDASTNGIRAACGGVRLCGAPLAREIREHFCGPAKEKSCDLFGDYWLDRHDMRTIQCSHCNAIRRSRWRAHSQDGQAPIAASTAR